MKFKKKYKNFLRKIEYASSTTTQKPRTFTIIRIKDETGISGKGRVLDGVVFSGGKTVISWISDKPSVVVYDTFEDFKHIHIDSHPKNKTEIIWL